MPITIDDSKVLTTTSGGFKDILNGLAAEIKLLKGTSSFLSPSPTTLQQVKNVVAGVSSNSFSNCVQNTIAVPANTIVQVLASNQSRAYALITNTGTNSISLIFMLGFKLFLFKNK